jgi:hypothetical protein
MEKNQSPSTIVGIMHPKIKNGHHQDVRFKHPRSANNVSYHYLQWLLLEYHREKDVWIEN